MDAKLRQLLVGVLGLKADADEAAITASVERNEAQLRAATGVGPRVTEIDDERQRALTAYMKAHPNMPASEAVAACALANPALFSRVIST